MLAVLQGEDEAVFQEYRKQLKVIFTNLASLDLALVLAGSQERVAATLATWRQRSLADVEVAVHLLYIIGEALPV